MNQLTDLSDGSLLNLRETAMSLSAFSPDELARFVDEHPETGDPIRAFLSSASALNEALFPHAGQVHGSAHDNEFAGRLGAAMKPYVEQLKQGSHNFKILSAATGAAASIAEILKYPAGASQYLINCEFPYHYGESDRLINGRGFENGAVTEYAALSLAGAAYYNMMETLILHPRGGRDGEPGPDHNPFMIAAGATCSTATGRARRGDDHIHGAIRTLGGTFTYYVEFQKGEGQDDRSWQDAECNILVINSILAAAGLKQMPIMSTKLDSDQLVNNPDGPGRILELKEKAVDPAVFDQQGPVVFDLDGRVLSGEETVDFLMRDHIVYGGSFDKIHFGHEQAAEAAWLLNNNSVDATHLNETGALREVVYEISQTNADPSKPDVSNDVLARRVVQNFGRHYTVVTKNAPYFLDKLGIFPNSRRILVGYDTAKRMLDPEMSKDGANGRDQLLQKLAERHAQVYVLGRYEDETQKRFLTKEDLTPPVWATSLFKQLLGQAPISSTQLRELQSAIGQ